MDFHFSIRPFLPVIFLVVMLTMFVYSAIHARKQREELHALARRLNLDFDPGKNYKIPDRFNFLKQFAQGSNRYATNVLSGNYRQYEIFAFDYHYETYSTNSKGGTQTNHRWFAFFLLTMPSRFPHMTVSPENFLTKVAEVLGYQDIKFESAEFSKAFCVRSPDRKFAYDVCNAKMMEYLLANRDLNVEIENNVIAFVFNTCLSVKKIESNLQRLIEIRSRLPEYLFAKT